MDEYYIDACFPYNSTTVENNIRNHEYWNVEQFNLFCFWQLPKLTIVPRTFGKRSLVGIRRVETKTVIFSLHALTAATINDNS